MESQDQRVDRPVTVVVGAMHGSVCRRIQTTLGHQGTQVFWAYSIYPKRSVYELLTNDWFHGFARSERALQLRLPIIRSSRSTLNGLSLTAVFYRQTHTVLVAQKKDDDDDGKTPS